jgi:hypothetical protein
MSTRASQTLGLANARDPHTFGPLRAEGLIAA